MKNFTKSIESLWDNNPTYDDLKAHDNWCSLFCLANELVNVRRFVMGPKSRQPTHSPLITSEPTRQQKQTGSRSASLQMLNCKHHNRQHAVGHYAVAIAIPAARPRGTPIVEFHP
jgi:hypothetical protein